MPHPATMEDLPYEVLSETFMRLSAKQVGQMRCVSKSWKALLSDSTFVKSHLHHSVHNDDNILLFFHWEFSSDCCPFIARSSRSPHIELPNFIKLPSILQSEDNRGCVVGAVNGLICFCYGPSYNDYAVHIWNPSLSAMLTLPPCSLPKVDATEYYFWFGYDPKTDDYKVTKLTESYSDGSKMLPEVEVYSMRKSLWELITQKFPSHIKHVSDDCGVCVDGHDGNVHWLGYTDLEWKKPTIVAFDLGAESFREIPLPDSILHLHEDFDGMVGVLAGKLCIMSCTLQGDKCEVWVMDGYESWIKHHVFSHWSGDIDIYPWGFTSRGEFLFEDDDDVCLYDPVAAQTKSFKIPYGLEVCETLEYIDSLVWVTPEKHEHELR